MNERPHVMIELGVRFDQAARSMPDPGGRRRTHVGALVPVLSIAVTLVIAVVAFGVLRHEPIRALPKVNAAGALTALDDTHVNGLAGPTSALLTEVHHLHGVPIVISVWASWCVPCRDQSRLLASASARYRRSVAFLGLDILDSTAAAEKFLRTHSAGYPSYHGYPSHRYHDASQAMLRSIVPGGITGVPITIFIDRAGKTVSVYLGSYVSRSTLDHDIALDRRAP